MALRDLPASVWAGHGWAFDENGLRRLSFAGGRHAMQGVEVFEFIGLAVEEVGNFQTFRLLVAAENPAPSGEQKPSAFPKVCWKIHCCWEVNFKQLSGGAAGALLRCGMEAGRKREERHGTTRRSGEAWKETAKMSATDADPKDASVSDAVVHYRPFACALQKKSQSTFLGLLFCPQLYCQ